MPSQDLRPKWWQLYLTFPLLIALFVVENQLKISARGHQAVQIGILLIIYGLVHLWLKANSSALSQMDQKQYRGTITVIQILPDQIRDSNKAERPTFQFPASEIKGVLSDTFGMDYIDAEFLPSDEVLQELDKE
jgi:hypothetical protein